VVHFWFFFFTHLFENYCCLGWDRLCNFFTWTERLLYFLQGSPFSEGKKYAIFPKDLENFNQKLNGRFRSMNSDLIQGHQVKMMTCDIKKFIGKKRWWWLINMVKRHGLCALIATVKKIGNFTSYNSSKQIHTNIYWKGLPYSHSFTNVMVGWNKWM
jgi:hypothetical protein